MNHLGNQDPALRFILLTDWPDAATESEPADARLLRHAVDGIDRLNHRHGRDGNLPFGLLHRRRQWNGRAGLWMGWERKRGKLAEFNALLRRAGDTSFLHDRAVDRDWLRGVVFVITLDADTRLPPGEAARLVGALAHPLNRPSFDERGRVDAGYTVIQPRLEIDPAAANQTRFSAIYSGDVTVDLYTRAVSDVYQDLFGEAVFAGKGIYDLDGFSRSLEGRIPPNAVLSHDLLEGLHGRVALASDIVLYEDYPPNLVVHLKRLHRWIRGDWQLLPWVFGRGPGGRARPFAPGLIGRWKLIDNLRRSLVAPASLALLALAWFLLPGSPWLWTTLFVLVPGLPFAFGFLSAVRHSALRWGTARSSLRYLMGTVSRDTGRWLLSLVFLPYEAFVALDAVLRTLYRVLLSRRRLLEWSTAARTARQFGQSRGQASSWARMWFAPVWALTIAAALAHLRPGSLAAAAPLLLMWLLSPSIAASLSRMPRLRSTGVRSRDWGRLRVIALRTWRFFRHFVGPETSWLPPDNYQVTPRQYLAERTSPTNIGMMLTATLAARDFGFVETAEFAGRLHSSLGSLQRLAKHRGHLYNWYRTRDLVPLEPRYVSTVDSGNLTASLIVVRQALAAMPDETMSTDTARQAIVDHVAVMRQLLPRSGSDRPDPGDGLRQALDDIDSVFGASASWPAVLAELHDRHCDRLDASLLAAIESAQAPWTDEEIGEFRSWIRLLRARVRSAQRSVSELTPWIEPMASMPSLYDGEPFRSAAGTLCAALPADPAGVSLRSIPDRMSRARRALDELGALLANGQSDDTQAERAVTWNRALAEALGPAAVAAQQLCRSLEAAASAIGTLIDGTDFTFLYDPRRELFHIGYNVSSGEYDPSYYDLLASEARIASFIAIAKGDVPLKHWVHLGRPLTRVRMMRTLLSWSATAFEYLMPHLFMRAPESGLLFQSCAAAVRQQQRFGRSHDLPWGISESAFFHLDRQQLYQYRAFGVTGLGLKWDQGDRLVVSPYASLLALPFDAERVVDNLERLDALGMEGPYGLYEAVDFGAVGTTRHRPRVVATYMAHHQGMILAALDNALNSNAMVERFHDDSRIANVEHLLYERLPRRVQMQPLDRLPPGLRRIPAAPPALTRWAPSAEDPQVAILTNGHHSLRVSSGGGASGHWDGITLFRWQPDRDGTAGGVELYVQDLDSEAVWRLGCAPPRSATRRTVFAPHMAEFTESWEGLLIRVELAVAPSADVEMWRVSITNEGEIPRRLLLSSYAELVLGDAAEFERHPAFHKLFVESRCVEESGTLLYSRRRRGKDESPLHLAHTIFMPPHLPATIRYQSDRLAALGRHGERSRPAAFLRNSGDGREPTGHTLDQVMAIGLETTVPPRQVAQCAFLTSVGRQRRAVLEALDGLRSTDRLAWAFAQCAASAERDLARLGITSEQVRDAQALLARISWPQARLRAADATLRRCRAVQSVLWRQGISGDRPIVMTRAADEPDLSLAEELLRSQSYLGSRGVAIDVVVLDETPGGYAHPVKDRLQKLLQRSRDGGEAVAGGLATVIALHALSDEERAQILAAASVLLDPRLGTLWAQLSAPAPAVPRLPPFVPQPSAPLTVEAEEPLTRRTDLRFDNGTGGLTADAREYVIFLPAGASTPAPWCNVLANPEFGTLVDESGSCFTWYGNSSENRLTTWRNDPVADGAAEAVFLRDEETGQVWSPTPRPVPDAQPYEVTHAAGITEYRHVSAGLEQTMTVFVSPELPVKLVQLRLRNRWARVRRITATCCVEWVLGNRRTGAPHLLVPEREAVTGALLVRNAYSRWRAGQTAFLASSLPAHGVSCDLEEVLGPGLPWSRPAALWRIGLSDRVAPCAQPGAAYQVHVDIGRGEERRFHFAIGAGDDREAAVELAARSVDPEFASAQRAGVEARWNGLLGQLTVATPDPALDALVNRWLLYQTVAARLWGRTGLYQSAGAYGFRDQLQDTLALLQAAPTLAREQILRAAAVQFEEGDVLHWWHPDPPRGVRTRCSDDLLWLPAVTARYVEATGDRSILDEQIPFLSAPPLEEQVHERYEEFSPGPRSGTLYEHCHRAIDARLVFGAHDLPFIGTGDWNDGLSRVGIGGRGESVWLAWFLIDLLRQFAPVCRMQADPGRAGHYELAARRLKEAVETHAWTGDWYLRAFYDDGSALGAPGADECEIDLNAQSWAVIAGGNPERAARAMQAVSAKLVDEPAGLIKLLAPPFDRSEQDPGYIKGYPPGIRENGAQYSHAAVWALWAQSELRDAPRAYRWLEYLNPLRRSSDPRSCRQYRVEPYVVAADIYSHPAHLGRGGWTWYTGAAAWLYRYVTECMLGFRFAGDRLEIEPHTPPDWPEFQVEFGFGEARYQVKVHEPARVQRQSVRLERQGRHVLDIRPDDRRLAERA
jgi:cyclic beta-1,2-glucan synthetase